MTIKYIHSRAVINAKKQCNNLYFSIGKSLRLINNDKIVKIIPNVIIVYRINDCVFEIILKVYEFKPR